MSIGGLQQVVRTQIAKTKDAAAKTIAGEPAAARGSAAANADPVGRVTPVSAVKVALAAHGNGNPAADALRTRIAQRGELPAIVVASLGGARYLVDVDGVEQALVLEGAAVSTTKSLLPGTELRLLAGNAGAHSDPAPGAPGLTPLARLVAAAARDDDGRPRNPLDPARMPAADPAPIADSPAQSPPAHLARSIKETVDASGLFYESHVAEWAHGKRAIESLEREPQARLAISAADLVHPAGTTSTASTESAQALKSIVREQLQALHAQQVAWQGELWPGQPAQIIIGRDPYEAAEGALQRWRARLALELPNLGRVEIDLELAGDRLGLALAAESPARDRLRDDARALAGQLAARGLALHTRFAALGEDHRDPR